MLLFLYYMWNVLYWLSVPQRICSRVVWRCILGCASAYLRDLCRPLWNTAGSRVIRFLLGENSIVPHARSSIRQHRAFSMVGPSIWNGLPLEIRLLPRDSAIAFNKLLNYKCHIWAGSASE